MVVMLQFLQDNRSAIASLLVIAIYWFILNFRSAKGNIETIDKKRIEKGMTPMTNDERQIVTKVLRSSIINDSIGAFIGGIVTIVVVYFIS